MTVEVNPHFRPPQSEFGDVAITPPIDQDFFIARVVLYQDQAICIFPKFFTIGCGFAKEEDWNTNLPIRCDAEEIYAHIEHNKFTTRSAASNALKQFACFRIGIDARISNELPPRQISSPLPILLSDLRRGFSGRSCLQG